MSSTPYETVLAMKRREDSFYTCGDYLREDFCSERIRGPLNVQAIIDCRSHVATFCGDVAQVFEFDSETVASAVSCFDRFLDTPTGSLALRDQTMFKLAAVTCLYTISKMNESVRINPQTICAVCNDKFTEQQVEEMETIILQALQWRVNPPTAHAFLREYLDLLDTCLEQDIRDMIYSLGTIQIEKVTREFAFVQTKRSTVALSALLNALQTLLTDSEAFYVVSPLFNNKAINHDPNMVIKIKSSLREELYAKISLHQEPPCIPDTTYPLECPQIRLAIAA